MSGKLASLGLFAKLRTIFRKKQDMPCSKTAGLQKEPSRRTDEAVSISAAYPGAAKPAGQKLHLCRDARPWREVRGFR